MQTKIDSFGGLGGGQVNRVSDAKQSAITASLAVMEQSLNQLSEELDRLEGSIKPVLCDPIPNTQEKQLDAPTMCDLERIILQHGRRIQIMTQNVIALRLRVQL